MSNTKLYLGTDLLDFTTEMNVKRQINDFRDLDVGASAKSYTLEIPLTNTNRKLLKHVQDVRARQGVTDTARLVANSAEIIQGKLRILSVNGKQARAIIEGNQWIDDVKGISIRDLSWVGGDQHTFTAANIENSWSAAAGAFYRYPLINFGQLYSEQTGVDAAVYPNDFYPMWNIEDIVTKLFADAGYQLGSGGFFASTLGQKLYILSAPAPAADDFIKNKGLSVYVDGLTDNYDIDSAVPNGNTGTCSIDKVMKMDSETTDEGADFSTGTFRYTAPEDGTYRFRSVIKIYSSCNDTGSWTSDINTLTWSIRKNGTPLETDTFFDTGPNATLFDSQPVFDLDTGWIHLEAGDYIDVHIDIDATGTNNTGSPDDMELYVVNGAAVSYLEATWDERNLWPGIGYTCDPAVMLPDVDSEELLKALKEVFNLRFFCDQNNRTMYVETSDDFYGSTVVDWRGKQDYSADVEQEVIAANYNLRQLMKYKADQADNAYKDHFAAYGEPFTKLVTLTNPYCLPGQEERINSLFAPTVSGFMSQIGHYSTLIIPRIFGDKEYIDASTRYPAFRPRQWAPRLLQWNGLTALVSGSFDYFDDPEDAAATNYTTFPYVECPDLSDMHDAYWVKDWRRIDQNKVLSPIIHLSQAELARFATVVNSAAGEGFRATYLLNIEGNEMYFIISGVTTDGDRVECDIIQKM